MLAALLSPIFQYNMVYSYPLQLNFEYLFYSLIYALLSEIEVALMISL